MAANMQRPVSASRSPAAGFTLVEILIVIAILGVLVAAFLPDLLGAKKSAQIQQTIGRLQMIKLACEGFEQKHHYYPPDDLQDPENKLQFKADNGTNTGIESLVAFLAQSRAFGGCLEDLGSNLTNTDNDDHGQMLPVLGRRERLEIADDWGTPLCYFRRGSKNGGFDKPQSIAVGSDQPPLVGKAARTADNQPVGANAFQLLSAGPDGQFGTNDDLSYPEN